MQTFRIIAKNPSHENAASKLVPAAVRFFVLAKFVRSKQHSALLYETAVLLFFAVINAQMRDDIICCRVNIRVRRKDVIADVLLDSLFQKQFADAVTKHTEDGFERFSKDFRQKVSGILTLQIAAIELNCFVNEVILRCAAVQLVVVLHLAPCCIVQPDGMTAFFLCFYGVHLLQK